MNKPARDRRFAELEAELAALVPDARTRKLFAALFDDGQGANARRALIRHLNGRALSVCAPGSLEARLWRMVAAQQDMLREARTRHAYLQGKVTPDGG